MTFSTNTLQETLSSPPPRGRRTRYHASQRDSNTRMKRDKIERDATRGTAKGRLSASICTGQYGKRRGPRIEHAIPNRHDSLQDSLQNLTFSSPIPMRFRGGYDSRRDAARTVSAVSRQAIPRKSGNRTPRLPNITRDTMRQKRYLNVRRPSTC